MSPHERTLTLPRCRDDLLTNCKEATKVSPTPWCFTVGSNKRRACTAEEGATRPLSWFFTQHQVLHSTPPHQLPAPATGGRHMRQTPITAGLRALLIILYGIF